MGLRMLYHFPSTSRAKSKTLHGDIQGAFGNDDIYELIFSERGAAGQDRERSAGGSWQTP
jgi:hypothetical protein